MRNVVKRRKKTLLLRIIDKVRGETSSSEQGEIKEFDNKRTNADEDSSIAIRRNELKTVQHDNLDVTVSYTKN